MFLSARDRAYLGKREHAEAAECDLQSSHSGTNGPQACSPYHLAFV